MNEEGSRRLGSLWVATAKNGSKYLKGSLDINGERVAIVCFRNREKRSETSPDFSILESRPFEKKIGANPPRQSPQKSSSGYSQRNQGEEADDLF